MAEDNVSLYILDYTDPENLISCEQKWIDLLQPSYNINPTAGNSKGYRHSEKTIIKISDALKGKPNSEERKAKLRNRIVSEETKAKLSAASLEQFSIPLWGHEEARLKMSISHPNNITVEVTDIETNISTTYHSTNAAARALNIPQSRISMYLINNQIKPFRGRYVLKKL